jgi:putative transposase
VSANLLSMIRMTLALLVVLARLLFCSRLELVVENLALRQQLALFKEKRSRRRFGPADRIFWVFLRRAWRHWASALLLVQPDTVVGWQRQGFRWFWRLRSRARRIGRPRIPAEVRELIGRMARDNGWGAPRIHGELVKLGLQLDERTVSRYLQNRPPAPDALERWMAFLRNHQDCLAGMDFFTVPTATFQLLWVFFVIHHSRRQVLHVAVTDHPRAQWIVQQLREAFPFGRAPRYVLCDRDGKYGFEVPATLAGMGVKPVQTAPRAPWQNGVAERWVGSVRRELLDHVVVFNQAQLHRLLADYVVYYHEDRCHLTLGKDTPDGRIATAKPSANAGVIALARVGGLQHRYEWREAA